MQKLVVIVGPTAVGKTALSLKLAKQFNGEIVSGDSMQIYRGLDIGTAKATPAEQAQVPHHLIDIANPTENYSAAKFVQAAQKAITDIASRGKLPILVGGTGFYVQALLGDRPLAVVPDVSDPEFVAHWTQIAHEEGEIAVRSALKVVDPISETRILPGQIRRLIRALLVSTHTGQPFSSLQPEPKRRYDASIIGLTTERSVLYDRINQRVDLMMTMGILDEAKFVQTLPDDSTAQRAIGYKELFDYLSGISSYEDAVAKLKQNSRRYAKRQMTWFNNQFTDIQWYDIVQSPDQLDQILDQLNAFMLE
ncbi:tRNA (adenosine(37)-N6)-dimethylallyltransferase MiaA [Weissella sagaensis]|uniref:tRNA dimethylallyltransferase n=1 Tax=Weissella sagaensis TaxID=2559928 RepID=A0ABW1RUA6_9LACO|nr:tRNA (adenosine(37)-N6)-dimethylallyltransferase MiaA [Weissella sagaensis]QDJ59285.1 tRNA (adenosine(37)-N6)-dimethylallyltransferase MiaA [Weissella hellenica]QEA56597.1 tRNA (adenosine(37)-N6)-dimethylallyltransferase MiaA [Weissella hellenica]UEG67408.1 tRNA (adenosine(37)-N6)-dimethylallyltransferase MiaA [Weissella hellenica]